MNFKIELLLLVVACAGYAVTQEDIDLSEPLNSTSTASTTMVESTSSSTASTAASTTTSTAASTSTKTSPTSAETSASTQHTVGPASTPKPVDFWAVKNNGSYCILLKASFLIDFKYKNTQNQTVTSTVNLVHSNHTSVEGSCGNEKQSIEIRFFSNWTLTLSFEKSNDKSYYQSEVRLVWDLKEAQIKDAPALWGDDRNNAAMFNTSKIGYLCLARMTLFNNASVENGLLSIYTEQLKLEAFQTKSDEPPTFSDQYERCKEDTISNLVPIIVGACLGGLIIIVLVAYLIGRKRSRRGYESV